DVGGLVQFVRDGEEELAEQEDVEHGVSEEVRQDQRYVGVDQTQRLPEQERRDQRHRVRQHHPGHQQAEDEVTTAPPHPGERERGQTARQQRPDQHPDLDQQRVREVPQERDLGQ